MSRKKFLFFLLILVNTKILVSNGLVMEMITAIGLISSIITIMNGITEKNPEIKMKSTIHIVSAKFDSLRSSITFPSNQWIDTLSQYDNSRRLDDYIKPVEDAIARIDYLYTKFESFSQNNTKIGMKTLRKFTNSITSFDDDYPISLLDKIVAHFVKKKSNFSGNILDIILEKLSLDKHSWCHNNSSAYEQLASLYNTIVMTEIKGAAMISFAYSWQQIHKNISYDAEKKLMTNNAFVRLNELACKFTKAIEKTSSLIHRCDPDEQISGKTYIELTQLVYAFAEDIREFIGDRDLFGCVHGCEPINKSENECLLTSEGHPSCGQAWRQKCPGRVFNCGYESGFEVCLADKNSSRKYEWIKDIVWSENKFGDVNTKCLNEKVSMWTHTFETASIVRCSVCVCYCEDSTLRYKNDHIRAISNIWSRTNTKKNMVATGVRFVARDRMIHIQLREGKLLPDGQIEKGSNQWVPLPEFIYDNNFPVAIYTSAGSIRRFKENIDYTMINLQRNKIYLDDIIFDNLRMLTEVRFNGLKLEAMFTAFDEKNGILNYNDSLTTFPYYHPELKEFYKRKRTELVLDRPDNPLKFKENVIDSHPNQFVKIMHSDLTKDASQTVIPFFDLLKVVTSPSMPITGIGLIHKGQKDLSSGGYISLKIYHLKKFPSDCLPTLSKEIMNQTDNIPYGDDDDDDGY